jgi:hypothetical protein
VTEDGLPVRFTQSGEVLNLIVLAAPIGGQLRVRDLSAAGQARLLADDSPVALTQDGADLVLSFARPLSGTFAPAVSISPILTR